jgi:deoxyribonuclease V
MKLHELHAWDVTPERAVELQTELAGRVETRSPLVDCDLVAGADVAYCQDESRYHAAVVVLRTDTWDVVEARHAVRHSPFPYIPGLFSFREAPALLEAFAQVQAAPAAVLLDGHGLAHPRRFGLACHVGLWLDVPCVGVGKSRLVGRYKEPGRGPGAVAPLVEGGDVVGSVVRTHYGGRPVFVSVGHRIDLASAVKLVLRACRGYRLPEPTRRADQLANELRRQGAADVVSP